METLHFLEHLTKERINDCRQLADELRGAALAEKAEREGRPGSSPWYSFPFRLLPRRLVPDLRPAAMSVRTVDPRDR